MSILDLDIFCGSVCRDHVADAIAAQLGHATLNAPVGFGLLVSLHFVLNSNRQIGANVANIVEVECGVFIFHDSSIGI